MTGKISKKLQRVSIYPKSHYVTPRDTILNACDYIEKELLSHLIDLRKNNNLVEAQRIEQRTRYDLEMLRELGY